MEDAEVCKKALYCGLSDAERLRLMAVLLRGEASDRYDNLDDDIKQSWAALENAFKERYKDSEVLRWRKANDLWQRAQGVGESVNSYITAVREAGKSGWCGW